MEGKVGGKPHSIHSLPVTLGGNLQLEEGWVNRVSLGLNVTEGSKKRAGVNIE